MELQNNLEDCNLQVKNFELEHIEYHTQIKILKQTLEEKDENIEMLTNEVETWINDLYKERIAHYNAEQNISNLEIKLQSIRKDTDKKYF